jgi:hypothetical protein
VNIRAGIVDTGALGGTAAALATLLVGAAAEPTTCLGLRGFVVVIVVVGTIIGLTSDFYKTIGYALSMKTVFNWVHSAWS